MGFSAGWSVRYPTLGQNFATSLKGLRNGVRKFELIYQAMGLLGLGPIPSGRIELQMFGARHRPNIRPGAAVFAGGSLDYLSPEVIEYSLLSRCGPVIPARPVVNQADDDIPHDRTPLF